MVENNVSLIDFTPTILDLLDITFKPALYEFQGESLVPMVKEEGRQRLFFAESLPLDSIAVKTSQWKYIERYQDGKRIYEELYDISIDEREGNDVISRYPEVVAEMRQKTGKFRGENKKLNDFLHKEITDTPFDEETVKRLKALGYI